MVDKKDILILQQSVEQAKVGPNTNVVVGRCLLDELLKGYTWALEAGYTGPKE